MAFLWHEVFFRPLLNLLIALYNTIGLQNLGLAIISLTIVVRAFLLPFSLKDAASRRKQELLQQELQQVEDHYGNSPSLLREEQKRLFKKYRFRKWPRIVSLGVQGFVLLILYQVFIGGIKLSKIVDELYPFVSVPRSIQTMFLGVDIAHPSFFLSFLTVAVLFGTIVFDHGGFRAKWSARDIVYAFGLPAASFFLLWILPAVKALFVLSSLIFGILLRSITGFFAGVAEQERLIAEKAAAKSAGKTSIPHPKERFK